MRNLFILFCLLITNASVHAQVPQKMSYQLVVRNSENNIVANQQVGVRVSILQGAANGNSVFTETHTPQTNVNGLASFIIGDGTVVTGNLSAIDWSLGPYFIKTDVDPAGGTNYSISSTTQLLSVPYAMHAGSVANQGKTYIILNGTVTDEEAAAIIATDAGTQTQFVYVQNTTALTKVDLSGVETLLELKIFGNQSLTKIIAPKLQRVNSFLDISYNDQLTDVSLPALNSLGATVGQNHRFEGNRILETLIFPALKSSPRATLEFEDNPILNTVSFPVSEVFGSLLLLDQPSVTEFSAPVLTHGNITINRSSFTSLIFPSLINGNIFCQSNPLLATVSAPNLQTAGLQFFSNPLLSSVSTPKLIIGHFNLSSNKSLTALTTAEITSGSLNMDDNDALLTLDFPKLKDGAVSVVGNKVLKSLSVPLLSTSGEINIQSNDELAQLDFPQLSTSGNITLRNLKKVTTALFPELSTCKNITINNVESLSSLSFVALLTADIISVSGPALKPFNFSKLTMAQQIDLGVPVPISMPALITCSNSITLFSSSATGAVELAALKNCFNLSITTTTPLISLPSLVYANTVMIDGKNVTSLSIPELKVLASNLVIMGSNLNTLSVPKLDTVSNLSVTKTSLTSLNFPQLRLIKLVTVVSENPILSSLSFTALERLASDLNSGLAVNFSNNRLTSETVNSLLATLVKTTPPLKGRRVEMKQLTPAPPTGQGLIDKATLVARPNTVNTD